MTTTQYPKLLSVDKWTEDDVCEWLKGEFQYPLTRIYIFKSRFQVDYFIVYIFVGIQPYMKDYLENFRSRKVNGKKLAVIDMSDLNDLVGSLSHKLLIYKSINNLIQLVKYIFSYFTT